MDYRTEFQLALSLHRSGRYHEADAIYASLRNTKKSDIGLAYYWGLLKLQLSEFIQARELLRQCYQVQAKDADILYHLGLAEQNLKNYGVAIDFYQRCIQLDSKRQTAWTNLAECYRHNGKLEKAVDIYNNALDVMPNFTMASYNLTLLYTTIGELDKAEKVLLSARIYPVSGHMLDLAQANLLNQQRQYHEAIALFRQALTDPELFRQATEGIVVSYKCLGDFEAAIAAQKQIVGRVPTGENCIQLALLELTAGDYGNAWQDYLYRYDDTELRQVEKIKKIRLSDLKGKRIVVYKEQALGDEILFLRLLTLIDSVASQVYYACESKVVPLISSLVNVVSPDQVPHISHDYTLRIGDLGYIGRVGTDRPVPPPFRLLPMKDLIQQIRQELNIEVGKPSIGLTWRAGTRKVGAMHKEVPLPLLASLIKELDAQFVMLQRQPLSGDIEQLRYLSGKTLIDASHYNDDLVKMLALVDILDDYVGVSNTNMHLRASVGKVARVLVPSPPDWRWGSKGEKSAWFPDFTVYRQRVSGDWTMAFAELRDDFRKNGSIYSAR